jgi:Arc/MetJ family transcription regulator
MPTNLKIDEKLLNEALRLGHFKTKKDAVNQALEEFVQHHRQAEILQWQGRVDFFEDYDYKELRKSR